jgi:predicted transcriptional regulator
MRRTNIYLDDDQLVTLQRLAEQRGLPVARLIRMAIGSWLKAEGVQQITEDEWQRRFASLLSRRQETARRGRFDARRVARDVAAAVKEVREHKPAGRH